VEKAAIVFIKSFAISLPSQPFLGHLGFHIFFHNGLFGAIHLFLQLGYFGLDIIAVKQLESFNACVNCKARVEPQTPPGGRCSKKECDMFQRIGKCSTQVSAQLLIHHGDSNKQSIHLWAFGPTLCKLAGNVSPIEVDPRVLILRPTFYVSRFENNAITGFTLNND